MARFSTEHSSTLQPLLHPLFNLAFIHIFLLYIIIETREYIEKLREHSPIVVCKNVLGFLRDILHINTAGYVHSDVRETNVVVNLDTARISLIDFGFLLTKPEFVDGYIRVREERNIAYYHIPPECLFFTRFENMKERIFTKLSTASGIAYRPTGRNTYKNSIHIGRIHHHLK